MMTVVQRARRRLFCNQLLAQATHASSAILLAFILLLLLGTEVLNWYWLLPIPLVASLIGVWLARRRLPSPYRTAQLLDRRMALADTLSTALYFSRKEAAPASADVLRYQFEGATRLAQTMDVRRAVPYTMPRGVYLLAALALVASSLFALRYGLSRSLDLRPPLARMIPLEWRSGPKTEFARNLRRDPQSAPRTEDGEEYPAAGQDQPGVEEPRPADPHRFPGQDNSQTPTASHRDAFQEADNASPQSDTENPEEGPAENQPDPRGGQTRGGADQSGRKSAQGDQPPGRRESSNDEDAGLLSKMKDAFQNLLSRMKPRQGNSGSQEQSAINQNSRQPGKGQQGGGKQQSAGDGPRPSAGQPKDSGDGQSGETSQDPPDSRGQGAGKSDAQQAGKQPGGGIGSQDGDKRIKQAEQLAAMGKINQIIGKRSANVTGQASVEVRSTTQQLQTPYAPRDARHAQTGAPISRDEIPVALQSYVEQYFEQVRKLPPPKNPSRSQAAPARVAP